MQMSRRVSELGLQGKIDCLLTEAKAAEAKDRRLETRYSFFRPVSITVYPGQTKLSAFSRDISAIGMGLLTNVPLNPGKVTVTVACHTKEELNLLMRVEWCQPCAEGWYLSGARFWW